MVQKLISLYLYAGIMLLSIMFVNSFLRSKSSYAKALGILSLTIQLYLLGYMMEINMDSLKDMMFWNQIQYFGIPFFPALWLVVSMLYTGRAKYLKGLKGLIIFAIPMVTFFIHLTNESHHLYYNKIELQYFSGMKLMLLSKGPWYNIHSCYVLLILALCSWFYYQRYRMSADQERLQFRLLLFSSVLPYIALILGTINLGGLGIDYTALILPPCILLINLALTRYNFMEIKVLARERVFEDSTEGLILLNRFNRIVDFNKASILLFQWFQIQLVKDAQLELLLMDQQELLESIKGAKDKVIHTTIEQEDHFVHISVRNVQNKEERGGLLIRIEDVTERENLKRRLIELATTDELSGLKNRREFRECAEGAYQHAKSYNTSISVLMMDLDYFKQINDSFGHLAGDAVIKQFSKTLQASFHGTDIIGRIGGEEFAVVMIATDAKHAYQKAELFRKIIEKNIIHFDTQQVNLTISIGVAERVEDTIQFDELLNRADHALYMAKGAGRNCTVVAY